MSEARQLTFAEFPSKWVWNKKQTNWTKRNKGRSVGMIYYAIKEAANKIACVCYLTLSNDAHLSNT
jgi:hypothetical protein